jgi:uncharacterized RDD family membrane protein YckC
MFFSIFTLILLIAFAGAAIWVLLMGFVVNMDRGGCHPGAILTSAMLISIDFAIYYFHPVVTILFK